MDAVFVWDGRDRGVAPQNRDLTLKDAVAASAVWVFQDIAGRIGHVGEAYWIERPEPEGGPVFFAHSLDLALPGAMAARTADAYAVLGSKGFPAPE